MPNEPLTVEKLFQQKKESLELTLLAGAEGLKKPLDSKEVQRTSAALMGWWRDFAHHRIQVIGRTEMNFLKSLDQQKLQETIETLFSFNIPCVILSKAIIPMPLMMELADKHKVPLFTSKLATIELMNKLSLWLDTVFAPRIYVHGTMVDVYGIGMLYTGKSGIGKSECALDLVERGHRLVADDVVEIRKRGDNLLIASGTSLLGHHMEIRGVGIIDIEKLFGIRAIRMQKRVELEVKLVLWDDLEDYERLGIEEQYTTILGVKIPQVTIPVSPGKNITAISEVIAMNFMLKTYGENTAKIFVNRISKEIQRKEKIQEYLEDDIE